MLGKINLPWVYADCRILQTNCLFVEWFILVSAAKGITILTILRFYEPELRTDAFYELVNLA
jgi:hypothetical protein